MASAAFIRFKDWSILFIADAEPTATPLQYIYARKTRVVSVCQARETCQSLASEIKSQAETWDINFDFLLEH